MDDVLSIIILRQFWSRRLVSGMQALPKIGGHLLTTKIGMAVQTGQTGLGDIAKMQI
jgi:hypothetical protein